MLTRQNLDGVVVYVSPLLSERGVPHAFSTRLGGISAAPFDSMNLGNPNGCAIQDGTDHIAQNYRRLLQVIGCGERELCRVHQVHGAGVVRVRRGQTHDPALKADALVTDDPSRALSIRIADCVPVLLATDEGHEVAAAHAGWRGVIAGVVPAALQAMSRKEAGARNNCVAAIGPCISGEAFEVGSEVLAEFQNTFGADSPIRTASGGKGFVDLRQAIRLQLIAAGISPNRIDTTDRCTFRDREEFFSHRRDNGVTGRMAALIAPVTRR